MIHSPASPTPTASLMSSLKLRGKSLPVLLVSKKYSLMSGIATSPLRCQKYTAIMRSLVLINIKTMTMAIMTNTTSNISL